MTIQLPTTLHPHDPKNPGQFGYLPKGIEKTHYQIIHDIDEPDRVNASMYNEAVWVDDTSPTPPGNSFPSRRGEYRYPVRSDRTWMPLNEPFIARIEIIDAYNKYIHAKDAVTGCKFTMSTKDIMKIIKQLDNGFIEREWSVQKLYNENILRPHTGKVNKPRKK